MSKNKNVFNRLEKSINTLQGKPRPEATPVRFERSATSSRGLTRALTKTKLDARIEKQNEELEAKDAGPNIVIQPKRKMHSRGLQNDGFVAWGTGGISSSDYAVSMLNIQPAWYQLFEDIVGWLDNPLPNNWEMHVASDNRMVFRHAHSGQISLLHPDHHCMLLLCDVFVALNTSAGTTIFDRKLGVPKEFIARNLNSAAKEQRLWMGPFLDSEEEEEEFPEGEEGEDVEPREPKPKVPFWVHAETRQIVCYDPLLEIDRYLNLMKRKITLMCRMFSKKSIGKPLSNKFLEEHSSGVTRKRNPFQMPGAPKLRKPHPTLTINYDERKPVKYHPPNEIEDSTTKSLRTSNRQSVMSPGDVMDAVSPAAKSRELGGPTARRCYSCDSARRSREKTMKREGSQKLFHSLTMSQPSDMDMKHSIDSCFSTDHTGEIKWKQPRPYSQSGPPMAKVAHFPIPGEAAKLRPSYVLTAHGDNYKPVRAIQDRIDHAYIGLRQDNPRQLVKHERMKAVRSTRARTFKAAEAQMLVQTVKSYTKAAKTLLLNKKHPVNNIDEFATSDAAFDLKPFYNKFSPVIEADQTALAALSKRYRKTYGDLSFMSTQPSENHKEGQQA